MSITEYSPSTRPSTYTGRANRAPQQWLTEQLGIQVATGKWKFGTFERFGYEVTCFREPDETVIWKVKTVAFNKTILILHFRDDKGVSLEYGIVSLGFLNANGTPHSKVRDSINAIFDQLEYQEILNGRTRVHGAPEEDERLQTYISNTISGVYVPFVPNKDFNDELTVDFTVIQRQVDFE